MGFFDKRSRQFRRKIRDLQAQLKEAEKEGKYIVEEGLFFAEMEDMGQATMIAFTAGDLASSAEEAVVRQFFDRNGLTVEVFKPDRERMHVVDIEIVPAREMVMAIGRELKEEGFKMVDDSESERAADLAKGVFPLSAVVRATAVLFCEQVQQVVSRTRIKKNKEGNRLLKWLPEITRALERKVPGDAIEVAREAFNTAYQRFYGNIMHLHDAPPRSISQEIQAYRDRQSQARTGEMPVPSEQEEVPTIQPRRTVPSQPTVPEPSVRHAGQPSPPRPAAPPPPQITRPGGIEREKPAAPMAPTTRMPDLEERSDEERIRTTSGRHPTPTAGRPAIKPAGAPAGSDAAAADRRLKTAQCVARMYRDLVRANPSRCVRNATQLLEHVHELLDSTAICVMVKTPQGDAMTIYAQTGKKLVWGEGGGEGYPVSTSVVSQAVREQRVAASDAEGGDASASMIMHHIECTVAAPIVIEGNVLGVLYLDRRGGLRPFTEGDCETLAEVVKPFEDFPDLTLGLV